MSNSWKENIFSKLHFFQENAHLSCDAIRENTVTVILIYVPFSCFQFPQKRFYKDQLQVLKYPFVQLRRKCLIVGHKLMQALSKFEE